MLSVRDFVHKYHEVLRLELCSGEEGLLRLIKTTEIERPGLTLTGFFKGHSKSHMIVFGRVEMEYLRQMDPKLRMSRLETIFSDDISLIVVARNLKPFKEMFHICNSMNIPLFRTRLVTSDIMRKLTLVLETEFAPSISCHGTLVECFGVGIVLQGDPSVGKSETALGLIERGHRLISDDVVLIRKKEDQSLIGSGPELTRHMLEIRGIGFINVAHLYGAVCVSEAAKIDIVVKLEEWDPSQFYDRVGLDEKFLEVLGTKVPFYVVPVKPGRDVALLLETVVLNHRSKAMGYHSAKEFKVKLQDAIAKRRESIESFEKSSCEKG